MSLGARRTTKGKRHSHKQQGSYARGRETEEEWRKKHPLKKKKGESK